MSEREELSRRLLEENGLREGAVREADREGLRAVVDAERRRSAHLRNVMLLSWAAFVVLFVGIFGAYFAASALDLRSIEVGRGTVNVVAVLMLATLLLAFIAFIVAIVATISWGLRLAFGPRGVEDRLEHIEAQLARLEAAQDDESEGGAAQQSRRRADDDNC
ncbi:MAG: nucleoside recognition domain-containing protein [Armatimonadota bacterium]|nr:nucleoside recognition domain-containing protein [Armatimonadota bacterium]